MKLISKFAAIFLLLLTLIPLAAQAEPIKIGVILPLTGDFAFFGEQAKEGLEIALQEINKDQKQVEVIYEDEKCLPKNAVTAFKKLVTIDKVKYLIGPACTGAILGMAPLANQYKINTLALLGTDSAVAASGEYIYALGFSSEEESENLAKYMWNKGIKTAGVIYETDAWAEVVKAAFIKKFTALGGKVLKDEPQTIQDATSTPDYKPVITKVMSAKPEALYVVPAYNGGTFLKQIRNMGYKIEVFGPDTFAITETIDIAKAASEGVICANAVVDETTPAAQKLREKLKAQFKQEPSSLFYSALGYDSLKVIFKAISSGVEFSKAMSEMKYDQGLININGFDQDGMFKVKPVLMEIKEGKLVQIP